jgi:hypothetical protein
MAKQVTDIERLWQSAKVGLCPTPGVGRVIVQNGQRVLRVSPECPSSERSDRRHGGRHEEPQS